MADLKILQGDCCETLKTLPEQSVHCCITSPPYFGLRTYLPDMVRIRPDLTREQRESLLVELDQLGIKPIDHIK